MYGKPEDGGTCPGATTGAGGCLAVRDGLTRQTCYMAKIATIYKAVGVSLAKNTELVKDKSLKELRQICKETVAEFIKKNKGESLFFRLHYSGDFFSLDYAQAWADVIKEYHNVQFWTYTRSHTEPNNFIETLLGIPNLTLYLSCDPSNFNDVKKVFDANKEKYNNLGMAFMGNDAPEPEVNRWVKCPEVTGKIKNDETGACSKCRLCVDNYKIRVKNISFNIH